MLRKLVDPRVLVRVEIDLGDKQTAESVVEAIVPETESQADKKRGKALVKAEGSKAVLIVESNSIGGARALANAYIYLFKTVFEVLDVKL